MAINWIEGFTLRVRIKKRYGDYFRQQRGIAVHLTALAKEPPGSHLHLDKFNSLEENSATLIVEKTK